jgi:hypothetical protein
MPVVQTHLKKETAYVKKNATRYFLFIINFLQNISNLLETLFTKILSKRMIKNKNLVFLLSSIFFLQITKYFLVILQQIKKGKGA